MTLTPGRGRVHVEDGPKRVRVYLRGELVADTTHVKLVYEVPYYPQYYIPSVDVRMELLAPSETLTHSPSRGDAHHVHVAAGQHSATDGAWQYRESPIEDLRELIRFDFDAFEWFEEDEPIMVHPRNPSTRVDILATPRKSEDRWSGLLLQREGRPHRGRTAARAAEDQVLLTSSARGRVEPLRRTSRG